MRIAKKIRLKIRYPDEKDICVWLSCAYREYATICNDSINAMPRIRPFKKRLIDLAVVTVSVFVASVATISFNLV